MITAILMILSKARAEAKRPGVADEPVVVVKRPAEDLHGDMRRGENGTKARRKPALGRKVSAEAKGGTHRKTDTRPHAKRRGIEKAGATRWNHLGKEAATYARPERPRRKALDPIRQNPTERRR